MRDVICQGVSAAPPFRLPESLRPQHYNIELEPDLEASTFQGRVVIQIQVVKATRFIVFHSARLNITEAIVEPEGGIISYPKIQYNLEQEAAYLQLEHTLRVGTQVILTLKYGGQFQPTGTLGGLVPTPYQAPDGNVKLGFETMFAPALARSVFPCFDEPAMKARFLVSLVVPSDLTCLSNMDAASEEVVPSPTGTTKKRVTFDTSPLMSTYLLVMVAGYFNMIETYDFHVPIRVWAALDKDINSAMYALEIAVKSMKVHERNFGLKYPLPKLDMVAIPGHQGGMEHWGCVTYVERSLVLPANPSVYDKIWAASLIAHELAHQWFGNIVTTEWWDSIWLNEAFAEWAGITAIAEIIPDFNAWASFVASSPDENAVQGFQMALDLDASIGSHPIQDPTLSAAESFDAITYQKGCSIIRMLVESLGVDVFLQGIRLHLKRFIYGNATTEQLWETLSEVSGRNIPESVAYWTDTVGYPLLTVNEVRPTGEIVITQSRFLQNGDHDSKAGPYPVSIQLRGPDQITTYPMNAHKTRLHVNLFRYKLNANSVGFYRVSYPLSRIHKFGIQFSGGYLSIEDQIGLVSDLGAVVATGSSSRRARLPDFLDFLFSIKDHITSLFVWREIFAQLSIIQAAFLFEGNTIQDILMAVRHQLVSSLIARGAPSFRPNDSVEQTMLKTLLFGQLKDHPLVQNEARNAWSRLLGGDKDALNSNIRRRIFEAVVYTDGTDETWNHLKSIALEGSYIHTGDPVTRIEAFATLGSSPVLELTLRSLNLITPPRSPATVASDAPKNSPFVLNWAARLSVLGALQKHPVGAEASWAWVRECWDHLQAGKRFGQINSYSYLGVALGGLATAAHLSQIEEFFADKTDESFEMVLIQALDKIRARSRFVEADREGLLEWAKQKGLSI